MALLKLFMQPLGQIAGLAALAVLIATGCAPRAGNEEARAGSNAGSSAHGAASTDTLLTLDRSPCFGTCPSYHLTVFEDGRVVYAGRSYVAVEDTVRAQISEAKVERLAEQFRAADFFSYRRSYTGEPECSLRATDHPTVRTSFRWEGQRQRVQHYHGCYAQQQGRGGLERSARLARLVALEDSVDAIVGTARWTGVEQ